VFPQPHFHLPPQFDQFFRQTPAFERLGLIQRVGLLLQQSQMMQRIENHLLPPVAAAMARNHFAGALPIRRLSPALADVRIRSAPSNSGMSWPATGNPH
jgi:hypothetical protein